MRVHRSAVELRDVTKYIVTYIRHFGERGPLERHFTNLEKAEEFQAAHNGSFRSETTQAYFHKQTNKRIPDDWEIIDPPPVITRGKRRRVK